MKAILSLIAILLLIGCAKREIVIDYSNQAIAECESVCNAAKIKGQNLSNGPCLIDQMDKFPEWVCDVAHNPRTAVDNQPNNQCQAFRQGKSNHFVEVDETCRLIKKV